MNVTRSGEGLTLRYERIPSPGARGARLLFASDLHLGWPWTRRVPEQLREYARATRPDAVLLGGDLCDGARSLERLTVLVRGVAEHAPVLAVPGNHDARLGTERVRAAVLAGGGVWLRDGDWLRGELSVEARARPALPSAIRCGLLATAAGVDAPAPRVLHAAPSVKARVLCAHAPGVVERARAAGFDLVLAGHLHGGQLVLFERGGRLYPYAWIDRWNGLRFELGNTTLVVSRGVGDAWPMRWRCPREVVLCELV